MNVDILWSKFLTEVKDDLTSLSFDNTSITWFRFFVNTFYTKSARNILALASSSKEVAQKDTS